MLRGGLETDAIVYDATMPAMDGSEFVRQLHARGDSTRVLFMTGYTEQAVVEHANGSALLNKPFSTVALLAQVRKLLDHPRA